MSARWCSVLLLVGAAACTARGGGGGDPLPDPDAGDDAAVSPDVPAFPDLPVSPDVPVGPDVVDPPVDNGPTCAAPRALCNGACVDRSTDPTHCGACNNRCPSGACAAGSCVTTPTCASPRVMCGATCTDVNSDAANCGVCGLRCAAGQSCAGGNCTGGATCTAPRRMCGAACTDVNADPANCGACGIRCPSGQSCAFGACTTASSSSPAGARCTNPDPEGGSDPACGADLVCIPTGTTPICSGGCTNSSSQTSERSECGGTGSTCLTQGDGATANSICTAACSPSASSGTGACRAGFVCTGWWYTHAGATPDTPGCFPFCSTSADCVGATNGSICNARTGSCGTTGVDSTRLADGSPCNPTITVMVPGSTTPRNVQCRGLCFGTSSARPTEGICGSFINLRMATSCPDDAVNIPPRAPAGTDNLAICIFKNCTRNSDCRAPHICRYPEDASGVPATTNPTTCDYPTAAQRTGTP